MMVNKKLVKQKSLNKYTTISLERVVKEELDKKLDRGISYNKFFKHLLKRYRDYPNVFVVSKEVQELN